MKVVKVLFKIFLISALIITLVIAGIALYMRFYGKEILQDALSTMLGARVRFENISFNLDRYAVNFKGFKMPSEIGFGPENIFNADKFTLLLDKDKWEKEKKVSFEQIIIKKATLNIERNHKGVFNISYSAPQRYNRTLAYAEEGALNIYDLAKNIKRLIIEDSVINFRDFYIPSGPFTITCDRFSADFTAKEPIYGAIPAFLRLSFRIPDKRVYGEFMLDGSMSVFEDKVNVDTDIKTKNIDLLRFLPYFNSYTPFSFKEGVFSSQTSLKVRDNIVDSLTTMVFHRLSLVIDPGMENAQFLEASVNRLGPYLMSEKGEIVFDFVIKGPVDNPHIGLGPRVKFAIGLVVAEEISTIIQQLQKLRGIK